MSAKPDRFLTPKDIAAELHVSIRTAYRIILEIPHVQIGNLVRVERVVFESWRRFGRPEFVYFVESGAGGPIKIGRAFDLRERLMRLQIGNPHELRVLGWIYGGQHVERELHHRFRANHSRGEWFERAPEIVEYIETHARPT